MIIFFIKIEKYIDNETNVWYKIIEKNFNK